MKLRAGFFIHLIERQCRFIERPWPSLLWKNLNLGNSIIPFFTGLEGVFVRLMICAIRPPVICECDLTSGTKTGTKRVHFLMHLFEACDFV